MSDLANVNILALLRDLLGDEETTSADREALVYCSHRPARDMEEAFGMCRVRRALRLQRGRNV